MKARRAVERIQLVVAKWGNSLAVRLPTDSAKQLGVGEGDALTGEIAAGGQLILAAQGRPVGKAAIRKLRMLVDRQKMTAPVVGRMRSDARY